MGDWSWLVLLLAVGVPALLLVRFLRRPVDPKNVPHDSMGTRGEMPAREWERRVRARNEKDMNPLDLDPPA